MSGPEAVDGKEPERMLIGRRVTALEFAPGMLVALEGSAPAISRATVIELHQEGVEPTRLKASLGERGFKAGRIHLVVWDAGQIHRTMLIPPMTLSERSLFLERELAREGVAAAAIGSQILRQVEDGIRKDEVLVVAAPREGLDRLLAPFLTARLTPQLVVTAPLALVKAAHVLVPSLIDRPTVIGHWGLSGLTVVVVADGVLRLARQIPRLTGPGLDPREWVVTEIERSIRHYTLISKGRRVEQVLFGNAEAAMEPVFSAPGELATRLGLPVLNLNPLLRPLLRSGVEAEAAVPAGVFLLSFGAALLPRREVPNLLPSEITVARFSRLITRTASAAAVLLALGLGGGFWWASREVRALSLAVERERAATQARRAELSEIERVEGERQRVRGWIRLLSSEDPFGGSPLADALKELSRLAPDRLHLDRLAISRDDRGYTMRLTGVVKEADLAHAQLVFNELYFGLRSSPFFYNVAFSRGKGPLAFELSLRLKQVR